MTEKELLTFKKEVKAACKKIGLEEPTYATTGTNFERYMVGFATVALSFDSQTGIITVEKYYDSELLHDQFGQSETFPHIHIGEAIAKCRAYLRSIKADEPILNGGED